MQDKTTLDFLICQGKQHPLTRGGQKSDDGGQRAWRRGKGAFHLRSAALKAKGKGFEGESMEHGAESDMGFGESEGHRAKGKRSATPR